MGWMKRFLFLEAFTCQRRKIPYIATHCTFGIWLPDFYCSISCFILNRRFEALGTLVRHTNIVYIVCPFLFVIGKPQKWLIMGCGFLFRTRKTIFVMPNVHSTIMQTSIIHSHLDKTNVIVNSKPNNTAIWLE